MLATPAKALFHARGWIYELKYDGFRCLATKHGKRVRLESRNGRDMAPQFPELVDAMRALDHDLVLDGELVICDERGHPQWDRLRNRSVRRNEESIRSAAAEDPAAIFAFDMLWLDGEDYRGFPLVVRKAMLRDALKGSRRIIYATTSSIPAPNCGRRQRNWSLRALWRRTPARFIRPVALRAGIRSRRRSAPSGKRSGARAEARAACHIVYGVGQPAPRGDV